ncbi:hypothetical protein AB5J62_33710 [Amycolatopsis sp. cg5]|uniref:hypothetical protein n=1 Tax=Amycolatopsis sp. cg5 TaxID=3238802 RepID=UPI0035244F1A
MSDYVVNNCQRCGHSADWHRFDDDQLVTYDRAEVDWTDRPFRCVGPGLTGCPAHCPDFAGEPVTMIEEGTAP